MLVSIEMWMFLSTFDKSLIFQIKLEYKKVITNQNISILTC